MEITTAQSLMEGLIYKPGWQFRLEDHGKRFEAAAVLHVTYPAQDSDRDKAPEYKVPVAGGARASFPIILEELDNVGFYREVMEAILRIEQHEAREFLRVAPTMWAPFHPHRLSGMHRWAASQPPERGQLAADLTFGVA